MAIEARVCSIERGSTLDGTGLRYVIFLTGCPFRCRFCHNPETWAIPETFPLMSVEDLVKNITRFSSFLTNGGVTVSGGEPTLHKDFLLELFSKLKELGMHTALDTCGYVDIDEKLKKIVELTDLFLLDIKHIDKEEHLSLTGKPRAKTLEFLKYINSQSKEIIIRVVMYSRQVNSAEYAKRLAHYLKDYKENITCIELLPYHSIGFDKWKKLELPYDKSMFVSPTKYQLDCFSQVLKEEGFKVKY